MSDDAPRNRGQLTTLRLRTHNRDMETKELARRLDEFFRVEAYPSEDFQEIIEFWRAAGVPYESYVTPEFGRRHNGLMVDNTPQVEAVYTLVFPSEEVVDEVVKRGGGRPALIFTHHPMDFETSGRGLIAMSEDLLRRLREARVSLYSAHAPLDCHEEVSTSRSLARAVGVPLTEGCAQYRGGDAGVIGEIEPLPLKDFLERVQRACGVTHVELKQNSSSVRRVAVVAGGAAFPPMMQEALDRGCDTYLTGDYQVRHGGPWAEEHKPEFDAFVEQVPLNLVGGSHFGTEALVLRREMLGWFNSQGLAAEFVPQKDAWR